MKPLPENNTQHVRRFSRRDLLKKGGLAGAAIAAPNFVPASVLGRSGTAPNDRIRMGFIGLGTQGAGHLLGGGWTYLTGGYLARDDVQVQAVCDVQQQRRERANHRCNTFYAQQLGQAGYKNVKAYVDFRKILERSDIDAVLLALPYHWAAPMAIMAARSGKDVYCEKPIAITVNEGQKLIDTCARYSRIYQAGMQQRTEYGGKFRIACELVRNNRIGQLKEVYAYRSPGAFFPRRWTSDREIPVPEGLNWDLWLGPLPKRPYGGRTGHALPGMYVGDVNWSPHHYDFIQWTLESDPTAPIEVEYDATSGEVHYHHNNGVVVHSAGYPGEPVGGSGGACFVGTEGRIAVDRDNLVAYPSSILKEPLRPGDRRTHDDTSHSGNFLDCVRTRKQTICHPETAVFSMNSILIGGIAMALKRTMKWDSEKLKFANDDEANRLLSYSKRSPWLI